MKTIKSKLVFFILLITGSCLSGINPQVLYQDLMEKYNLIETFQADIQQTSYYSEIDYYNVSEGRIYHNPDKIFIEYSSPKLEQISLSDNVVRIYQAEADRMIITYADSTFATLNIKYLIEKVWNDETVSIVENDSIYVVKIAMTEKNAIANITNVEFSIDKNNKLVEKVKYQDDLANEVQVIFSNILLNEAINDELWDIDISPNTQIIDYRE